MKKFIFLVHFLQTYSTYYDDKVGIGTGEKWNDELLPKTVHVQIIDSKITKLK